MIRSTEMDDVRDRLQAIVEMAQSLRDVGVAELTIADMKIVLLPSNPPMAFSGIEESSEPVDPLDDPLTYGRRSGVPGLRRQEDMT